MRGLPATFLAIGALYLTIWPHELGHSGVAYLYGCKANWWQTDTSWLLWSSWAGPVDYPCLQAKGGAALGLTEFAGIGVNLVLLGLAPLLGRWWRPRPAPGSAGAWVLVATVFWALANYAEAFSYLILNTLWLSSDMKTVVLEAGVSRWAWLAVGLAAAVLVGRTLRGPLRSAAVLLEGARLSRRAWLVIFVGYVTAVSLAMGAARIVLTPPPSQARRPPPADPTRRSGAGGRAARARAADPRCPGRSRDWPSAAARGSPRRGPRRAGTSP
jgi:hypothetical protein